MKEDFAEKLRKIRVLKNFSQEHVADQIGVSLSTYSRYEGGKAEIDFFSVVSLAHLYRMTVDQLMHFGEPGFSVEETQGEYIPREKILITVELDGLEDTLSRWVKKLTAINKVIGTTL